MIRIRAIHGTASLLSRDRMAQVRELFVGSFPRLADYADEIPSLLRDPMQHGYRTVLLIAEGAQGRVDAFALVMHFPDLEVVFLDFMATRPGVRGHGLGGALYEAVREFSRNCRARALFMEVQPDDPALTPDPAQLQAARKRIRFYERYGVRVVENPAYCVPVGDPPTTAFLLFDGLGRPDPLSRREARAAVARILAKRFGQIVEPAYVRDVMEAFRDDPVPLRPIRNRRPGNHLPPSAPARLSNTFSLVATPRHELHHVRERGYFERPVRVQAIREALEPTGWFTPVSCREHRESAIVAVHDRHFVHFLRTVCTTLKAPRPVYPDTFPLRPAERRPRELPVQAGYYCIDSGTPLYPGAYRAARASVDAVLTAADELLAGKRLVYAVCRPPGHHAGKRFYGGFCYFNNAAVAAQYLLAEGRVALLDLDFHHGNGTQDIFYERDDVFTVSIHGHPHYSYPYFTGYPDETGQGAGLGSNFNLPLRPGADEAAYLPALDRALDRIGRFRPDILICSLGFDIIRGDPTGTFRLAARSLRALGRRLATLDLPLLVAQEGGYNLRNIRRGAREFFAGCADAALTSS